MTRNFHPPAADKQSGRENHTPPPRQIAVSLCKLSFTDNKPFTPTSTAHKVFMRVRRAITPAKAVNLSQSYVKGNSFPLLFFLPSSYLCTFALSSRASILYGCRLQYFKYSPVSLLCLPHGLVVCGTD